MPYARNSSDPLIGVVPITHTLSILGAQRRCLRKNGAKIVENRRARPFLRRGSELLPMRLKFKAPYCRLRRLAVFFRRSLTLLAYLSVAGCFSPVPSSNHDASIGRDDASILPDTASVMADIPMVCAPSCSDGTTCIDGRCRRFWERSYRDKGAAPGRALAVALDGEDNVFATGIFQGRVDFGRGEEPSYDLSPHVLANEEYGCFVVSLNPAGGPRWSMVFPSSYQGHVSPSGIAVASAGRVYVAGTFGGASDRQTRFGDMLMQNDSGPLFVAALDMAGSVVWVRTFRVSPSSMAITADAGGNAYLAVSTRGGTFDGRQVEEFLNDDLVTVSLSPAGTVRWTGQGGHSNGFGASVAVTGDRVWVAGAYAAGIGGRSETTVYVQPFTLDGTPGGQAEFTVGMNGNSAGLSAGLDGRLYVSGAFGPSATFGERVYQSTDLNRFFIASIRPGGGLDWFIPVRDARVGRRSVTAPSVDGAGGAFLGVSSGVERFTAMGTLQSTVDFFQLRSAIDYPYTYAIASNGRGAVVAVGGSATSSTTASAWVLRLEAP